VLPGFDGFDFVPLGLVRRQLPTEKLSVLLSLARIEPLAALGATVNTIPVLDPVFLITPFVHTIKVLHSPGAKKPVVKLTVLLSQFLACFFGKGFEVGFPSRAPADMPLPHTAQNGSGIFVVPRPEAAFLTRAHRRISNFMGKTTPIRASGSDRLSSLEQNQPTIFKHIGILLSSISEYVKIITEILTRRILCHMVECLE
jgi:hypothetical protein